MEPRKYSTGTKGRIKMHADKCKELIHTRTSFNLAREFIESLDPAGNESMWQRFQNPEDVLPELQAWLDGGEPVMTDPSASRPANSKQPAIRPASDLLTKTHKPDEALEQLLVWLESADVKARLESLSPRDAAELAIRQFHKVLNG